MSRDFNKVKIIYSCNAIFCGINNINAGCSGNIGKNLEIDLDNFKNNIDIVPTGGDNIINQEAYYIGLDNNSIEKLKNLKKELEKLYKEKLKKNSEHADDSDISKKIDEKEQEIKKVRLNKFYFFLERLDEEESYMISYKKTNINIKGYQKAKEEYKDILNLYQKYKDSSYDGCSELTNEELVEFNTFKEKNKELFILYKVTYLEKKVKGSDKSEVVKYFEIIDIYKRK